jgi:hypothetical protein
MFLESYVCLLVLVRLHWKVGIGDGFTYSLLKTFELRKQSFQEDNALCTLNTPVSEAYIFANSCKMQI